MSNATPDRTPEELLFEEEERKRVERLTPRHEDGLIIYCLKWVCTLIPFHYFYNLLVPRLLPMCRRVCGIPADRKLLLRHAADAYMLLTFIVLVLSYALMWAFAFAGPSGLVWAWVPVLFCLAPVFRIGEAIGVIILQHANGPYKSPAPMRAVSKTLWAYIEFVVAFATIYLAVGVWAGDPFRGTEDDKDERKAKEFRSCPVNPLYFSMMTIATVGYGDYSPQTAVGRSVAAIQVFCGLILLVIALQRALTGSEKPSETTSDANRTDRPPAGP